MTVRSSPIETRRSSSVLPGHDIRREARIAGWFYLVVVLTGPFVLLYVPGKIFTPGDALSTAANLRAHETLYRASIAAGLAGQIAFLLAVLALARLLRRVDPWLSTVMAALILLDAPLSVLGLANQAAALHLATAVTPAAEGARALLAGFEPAQRDALATLLLHIDRHGVVVSEVLWGLWLLPLGWLVVRSRFLPRWLGAWLVANGLAYVVLGLAGILAPEHHGTIFRLATPLFFGEMVLALWLVTVGARPPAHPESPGAPATVGDSRS